jgi:ABC-2 type transport system permease protein
MRTILDFMARVGFLCRKELLMLVKDPSSRAVIFAPALLQSLLFGYGATYDLRYAPYAVLDQSGGAASTRILSKLDGAAVFSRVATIRAASEIADVIDSGQALLVLSFPTDFESRLASGQAAPLQLILDGRNSSTAGAAAGQIGAIVAAYNQERGGMPPITIDRRAWYNPNLESRWFIMPALIAALSMLQTLLLAALSVAREREQGTFDQLLVTPLTPMQILIGKALPSILVGILQSTIILLIIRFWFQIPLYGSVWLLYLGLVSFTTAAVGIGLSISALSVSMQQAMLYTFLLIMPMMLLSGLYSPIENMPRVLQIATYVNPLRFGMDLVRRVYLEGAGPHEVAFDFVPMLCIAGVTLPLAAWLFRNRLT